MILVTGGAGFIGSHTCVALADAGYKFIILDNYSNSSPKVLSRIEGIVGYQPLVEVGDIRDSVFLNSVFGKYSIEAVIHFAGLKAVGDSVRSPIDYYDNNVTGTLSLIQAMKRARVKRLVFSSSATVYGEPKSVPIEENFPRSAINPYGRSKLIIEHILEDLYFSDDSWNLAILRYFNPVGAHESGRIGENPRGTPNNLMPWVAQVAVGRRPYLEVFGADYPTHDGTGVRDYIHVMDLAEGHVATLQSMFGGASNLVVNLGTGHGVSVLELIAAFEKESGKKVPYRMAARRVGDVAECWASVTRAEKYIGWSAKRSLSDMCRDAWRWQSANPNGYDS